MSIKTIWKFSAPVGDTVTVDVAGRLIRWLHVEPDGREDLTLWGEVEPGEPSTEQVFVRGTGHSLTGDEGTHIGTVIADPFVWHVFAKVRLVDAMFGATA